jgi:type IV secretory pathway VirB2 component (pilin)
MKKTIIFAIWTLVVAVTVGFSASLVFAADTTFANPIGVTTLQGLLQNILKNLQGVVAIIAIIFIIIGGIMYMFAGVDEKMVERAKMTISGAIIGIAIIFAAPAFLKEIITILCGNDTTSLLCAGSDNSLITSAPTLKTIAERILNLLLSIVGIIGIIGLIIGGGFYLTAYGEEDRINKGKSVITASLLGIIIAAASLIIVRQVSVLLS